METQGSPFSGITIIYALSTRQHKGRINVCVCVWMYVSAKLDCSTNKGRYFQCFKFLYMVNAVVADRTIVYLKTAFTGVSGTDF